MGMDQGEAEMGAREGYRAGRMREPMEICPRTSQPKTWSRKERRLGRRTTWLPCVGLGHTLRLSQQECH